MKFKNLDSAEAFKDLCAASAFEIKEGLTPSRIKEYSIDAGGGLTYHYGAMPVDEKIIDIFQKLSDEQELIQKYLCILSGMRMNTGENRAVLHHLTRGAVMPQPVELDGENKGEFYLSQLEKIKKFSERIRSGKIVGSTGKSFTTVCQIGIGGSDLGPRALYLALENYAKAKGLKTLEGKFISNVDPDDATAVISSLDLERTLFVLVSKSGTTLETLTNRDLVIEAVKKSGIEGIDPAHHMVAVTSKTSPLAKNGGMREAFFFDDYIGGRYSSTSPVGGVILSLAFGYDVFAQLLEGAHECDEISLANDVRKNAALMDALIGLYLRNCLHFPSTAILPYSQALSRFPAHLQQLDMESNGKSVNRDGEPVDYPTGPVIFGEPGTNGQHSFYQLLHQGTDIVPLQFIGFKKSQRGEDIEVENSTSQQKLNANLAAQIVAFARGKDDENPNKRFSGNRPSSLITGEQLDPRALGALLSHYENKVMFQGLLWNLNSFDQEGVQLGKVLAKKVLAGCEGDEVLASYSNLLI